MHVDQAKFYDSKQKNYQKYVFLKIIKKDRNVFLNGQHIFFHLI